MSIQSILPPAPLGEVIGSDFSNWGLAPEFETILVTGATGLVGRWLLTTLNSINLHQGNRSRVVVVCRNLATAREMFASLSSLEIDLIHVREISTAIANTRPRHIWHLSADTGTNQASSPLTPVDADLGLTIEICRALTDSGHRAHILYTSSGAVYGRESAPIQALPLQTPLLKNLDHRSMLYGNGKVTSEMIFASLADNEAATVNVARLFSFIGPLMPLSAHFAMGNFLDCARTRRPIVLKSSGEAIRSWMYLGDLSRTLLLLASLRSSNIVDVGSEEPMSVRDAAELVAEIAGVDVVVGSQLNPSGSSMSYIPDLTALRALGSLPNMLTLSEAISITLEWLVAEGGGFEPPRSLHP